MSEEIEQQQPTEVEIDELATLKARADMMGIKYHPSTGVDKLKAKIDLKLAGKEEEPEVKAKPKSKEYPEGYVTDAEFQDEAFRLRKQTAGKLIRVRVTCMNPSKKEWDGEIISVGSSKIGTYKKFVKFNTEEGWHIPFIIYEYLKEKKCAMYHTVQDNKGNKVRKSKLVNEFNIEVLPALTKEELKDLAQRQAMEAGKEA
jgi:hypothetical protein